jgi:hypothetical protein
MTARVSNADIVARLAGGIHLTLTGQEPDLDSGQNPVSGFTINPADPGAYFMPGADPGRHVFRVLAPLLARDVSR